MLYSSHAGTLASPHTWGSEINCCKKKISYCLDLSLCSGRNKFFVFHPFMPFFFIDYLIKENKKLLRMYMSFVYEYIKFRCSVLYCTRIGQSLFKCAKLNDVTFILELLASRTLTPDFWWMIIRDKSNPPLPIFYVLTFKILGFRYLFPLCSNLFSLLTFTVVEVILISRYISGKYNSTINILV